MADSTGSRDDLRIDSTRCLPIRFSGSSCRRCVDICPHHAISLEGRLAVDNERCTGCLLCTTVCLSGALEPIQDFDACLAKLAKVAGPVLGCGRTTDSSNAAMACLGGLSSEHLLALHYTLPGMTLLLNLSRCGDCANSAMLPILQERLQRSAAAAMDMGGCRIETIASADKIKVQHESIDRRGFFRSLGSTLFQSAAAAITATTVQGGQRSNYAEKRLPLRRVLLNRTINKLTPELQGPVRSRFDSSISFTSACTACQGCAAICPAGALQTEDRDVHPAFLRERCSGCGLCVEFCLDHAVSLTRSEIERSAVAGLLS
ncbi:MAG: 4Fe-4S dicluster domain-containing protein [Desulfuromonadaceae bacterium]